MSLLDTVLGLGYSGYAIVAGKPILLNPSNPTENDNLIKSSGSYATDAALANGQLPTRDRRSLTVNLETYVTPDSASLIRTLTYAFRTNAGILPVPEVPLELVMANREGYSGLGHVDSLTISAQENSLTTMSIAMTLWVWTDLFPPVVEPGTPRVQKILPPFSDVHKPIASHNALVFPGMIVGPSVVTGWQLVLTNNWQYVQLLEGTFVAPNPRLIYPGPLDSQVSLTWLARNDDRPLESGDFRMKIGVPTPVIETRIPRMVRDPNRSPTGVGAQNEAVRWTASYYALGAVPTTP